VRVTLLSVRWSRSALVVVPAGGDADLVGGDLVDEAVLVGDPAGPVSLKAMLKRLGLADPLVAVALNIGNQGADPLQDLPVLGLPPDVVRPGRSSVEAGICL
jgi:hypothetical protein